MLLDYILNEGNYLLTSDKDEDLQNKENQLQKDNRGARPNAPVNTF